MRRQKQIAFPKIPTGINGLDEITNGGFPKGRPILICGGAGCGKTLFGVQFIVKGITEYDEPGVIMSFEESAEELTLNSQSLGFDLEKLKARNKLRIDYVRIERSEIEETGEYDMEALFIRLNYAIDAIGAKRVVLDTIESLFSGIDNTALLRSELRRLFRWLKDKGVTAVITGERGVNSLTREGLEEYISDCVILLDFRVIDQIATRRLRIVKYRGSTHGTNEYPFLIDEDGISVIPVTSLRLDYKTFTEIISTGHPGLDKLFSHHGIYRGNSTMISGTAGTAKTILASYFAMGSCRRKERVLFFSFEESPEQLIRNARAIGINFKPQIKAKLLHIHASRPTLQGLETHLLLMQKLLDEFKPKTIIIDPISSFTMLGTGSEVRGMLIRLMDMLKMRGINALFTSLTHRESETVADATVDAVSSLTDTWIDVKIEKMNQQRVRSLLVVKSRGTGHEANPQQFFITDKGLQFEQTELE